MRGKLFLILLGILLLAGCACSRDLVPSDVLEGLHKPVVKSISPEAIRFSDGGFFLWVQMESTNDAQYVLYINGWKVGQVNQGESGFSQYGVGWMISKELIDEFLAASSNSAEFSVRVTGINESYDIAGDFDNYSDYVSEPMPLEITKGDTQFSTAKKLFPDWTHSREPVIRYDSPGNIFLAWLEKVNGIYQAFFSFSADNGETWSQVLNISRSSDSVDHIDIASDGAGHFYMSWMVFNNDVSDIYFCRSLNNGATWYVPERMNPGGRAINPELEVDDRGGVYLAWHRREDDVRSDIRLAVSRDLGNTWKTQTLGETFSSDDWGMPLLAWSPSGPLYLFNGRYGGTHQFLDVFSSIDHGGIWQKQEVASGDIYPLQLYSLACFGPDGQIYLAWGYSSYAGHYYFDYNWFMCRDSSKEWSAIQDLGRGGLNTDEKTALAVSGNSVDAVLTGSGCLFLLRSADNGRTWPVPETVSGSDGYNISCSQGMVRHPSGKTFLVFVRKTTPMDGCLYLTSFE